MYTVQAGMHWCHIPILYPGHTQGSDHPDKRSTSRFQLPAGTVQIGLYEFNITYKLKHLEHTPKTANKHLKPVLYRRSRYSGFRPKPNPMSKHASMAQYRSRIARREPHTVWGAKHCNGIARIVLSLASSGSTRCRYWIAEMVGAIYWMSTAYQHWHDMISVVWSFCGLYLWILLVGGWRTGCYSSSSLLTIVWEIVMIYT